MQRDLPYINYNYIRNYYPSIILIFYLIPVASPPTSHSHPVQIDLLSELTPASSQLMMGNEAADSPAKNLGGKVDVTIHPDGESADLRGDVPLGVGQIRRSNHQRASILVLKLSNSLSLLIFSKVSFRMTSSSTMQSTTLEASTSSSTFSLPSPLMNFLSSSLFFASIISIEYSSSPLSSSRIWTISDLRSASSLSTMATKFFIMGSSFLSSYSRLTDSWIVVSYLSTFLMKRQERARDSFDSQTERLIARDIISMHFWWFFTKMSFLKFQRKGLFALQVLRRSLFVRGLQIRSELLPSCLALIDAYRFWEALRVELALVVSERVKDLFRLFFGVRSLKLPVRTSSPFLISQAKISDQSDRSVGFLVIIRLRSFTTSGEILGWLGMTISSSSIIMMSLPMLLLSKGQNPQSILKSTTPKDQMSDLMEQVSPLRISGAMQMGDPSMVLEISSSFSRGLQNPKSASLMMPSCRSKFSGLRSRCMILFLLRTLKASTIWAKQVRAIFSGRLPLSFNSFYRVPPLQYSQTKQKLLTVLSMSKYLMMCGQDSRLVRILISLQVPSSSLGYCLNFSALTILIATSCLFFMLIALKTVEYIPRPISFWREQFSIILPIALINQLQFEQTHLGHYKQSPPLSRSPHPKRAAVVYPFLLFFPRRPQEQPQMSNTFAN